MAYADTWLTDDDHRRIAIATSFPLLVEIAIKVITRNRKPSLPVIQVCGPMTTGGGTFEENNAKIERTIVLLRSRGMSVFGQTSFRKGMLNFTTIEDYLRDPLRLLDEFYGELFRGGYVQGLAFISGWEQSLGCRWEHEIGTSLGLGITYLCADSSDEAVLF